MTHPHTTGTPPVAYDPERWWKITATLGLIIVALVALVISYTHQRELALGAGQSEFSADIWPASVDGLVLACGARLALDRIRQVRRGAWATAGFWTGFAASLTANWLSIPGGIDTLAGIKAHGIAASPALFLLLSYEATIAVNRYAKMSTRPLPVAPDTQADKPQVITDIPADIPNGRVSAPKSARVSALAERFPNATATELAALARTSDRTVRRTLSRTDKVNGAPFLAEAEALPGGAR